MNRKYLVAGTLAYAVPTFLIAAPWHMLLFAEHYAQLAIYRDDKIVPFGLASMLIQGLAFAYLYAATYRGGSVLGSGLRFALIVGPIAWSFMVLAVAAKHPMTSVSGYMTIETAFTVVQYLIIGPLLAFTYKKLA